MDFIIFLLSQDTFKAARNEKGGGGENAFGTIRWKKATKPEFVVEGRDEGGRQMGKRGASDAWVAQPAPPPEGNLLVEEL